MNSDYPILVFPKKATVGRTTRPTPVRPPHVPKVRDNACRISPKFQALQCAMEGRRMHIQQGVEGADPEDVLVLETAGSVDKFYNAIKLIKGLEWLLEADDLKDADDDFYEVNDRGEKIDKKLSTRLYLVSTNTKALNNLVSLYDMFVANQDDPLDRGLGRFKDVFKRLKEVRFWDHTDRLDGSNFMEEWLSNHEIYESIRFQVELWYRNTQQKRNDAQRRVEELVQSSGGMTLSSCDYEGIRYHAVLVEIPGESLRQIITNLEDGSLIQCRDVMFFKPMPQTMMSPEDERFVLSVGELGSSPLPTGKPIVALLDGYPMENHMYLENRLVVDDPDGFNDGQYLAELRKHGTEMASLIIHGDVNHPGEAIDTLLYVRPIMKPNCLSKKQEEQIPENILLVDLVHRAVKRIFDGDGHSPAYAPTVKIISFSIGDNVRKFMGIMSPLARMLDWLSYHYRVLFIVSAGNNYQVIPMGCPLKDFKNKGTQFISETVTRELINRRPENRILSPAETINNISVGSVHADSSNISPGDARVNPYNCLHPAMYTPFGGGFRKSVKPDMVFDGGRELLEEYYADTENAHPSLYKRSPGIGVAWPDNTRDKIMFDRGTSCSAALMSRHAYFCYKKLREVLILNNQPETNIHLLVKALVVHGCSWEMIEDNIEKFLPKLLTGRDKKTLKRHWIGYGYPDLVKSLECNPLSVTVLGFGELRDGEAHVYKLPLPKSMDNKKVKRKLTVTLAWMSEIAPQNQRYRKSKLWFELTENKEFIEKRIDVADENAPKAGTLQHEIFVGERMKALPDNEPSLGIKVNCTEDAGKFEEPAKYAIAVTLEWGGGVEVDLFNEVNIYQEVRDRLRIPVPIINKLIVNEL